MGSPIEGLDGLTALPVKRSHNSQSHATLAVFLTLFVSLGSWNCTELEAQSTSLWSGRR